MSSENVNQAGAAATADGAHNQEGASAPQKDEAVKEAAAGSDAAATVASDPVTAEPAVAAATQMGEQPGDEPVAAEAAPSEAPASVLTASEAPPSIATPAETAASAEASGESSSPEGQAGQDFGSMLDSYEKETAASIQEGEVVRGIIVDISEQNVLIDIGYKSEGIVPREEFTDHNGNLVGKPGDEIDVLIKSLESQDGYAILSRVDAVRMRAWDHIRNAHLNHETVIGRVIERIKGGLKVDVDGVTAFLPGSQVDVRPVRNLEAFRGQEIEARVIKLNRKRGNVVLSRKAVLEESNSKKKGDTLANIEEGAIMEGVLKSITEYGAFVDLGGIDGLLHITDMSWSRIQSPNEMFKVGDTLQVKVLKFDREKERISLGYKQLVPDPWQSAVERYPAGTHMNGKVVSLTDYGAFVELEPGVEGLVHVTEMTWSKRLKHPSKLLSIGQEVEAVVLEVDQNNRRISLGLKQIDQDPWETLASRYSVGSRVSGKVRSLTNFGAFVEIEDGIDGLVHVSDISWTKRIKHPSDVLKKGQQVDAVITSIDVENRRLSLSMKDLEPNAWERFFETHRPGNLVKGKVVRFASFGAFVELEEGIEGLCHVSELSDERIEKPEDVVKIGQVMTFKILKLDPGQKKIGLSARAVGKDNDPEDIRSYQETGAGMATFGDIANLLSGAKDKSEN